VICWSCERESGGGATCASCGALQPPDERADHFTVLGVARRYDVDVGDLERRYKELSRQLHPDRFAKADPRARRASLGRTVQLNEAWRTLKDPVRRAEYLLVLAGVKVGAGEAPPALLMETLELREELGEARLAGDHAKVRRMGAAMRERVAGAMSVIGNGLSDATPGGLARAERALVELRYYQRFLDEVALHEDARDERDEEAGAHAG
jgi:molecular chaperone HscB